MFLGLKNHSVRLTHNCILLVVYSHYINNLLLYTYMTIAPFFSFWFSDDQYIITLQSVFTAISCLAT